MFFISSDGADCPIISEATWNDHIKYYTERMMVMLFLCCLQPDHHEIPRWRFKPCDSVATPLTRPSERVSHLVSYTVSRCPPVHKPRYIQWLFCTRIEYCVFWVNIFTCGWSPRVHHSIACHLLHLSPFAGESLLIARPEVRQGLTMI